MSTISELVKQGIDRVRLPHWGPGSLMRLDLNDNGTRGPWGHVFTPPDFESDVLLIGDDRDDWEAAP